VGRGGLPITVMIDPVNPDRHQFDRETQLLRGWIRLAIGLPLGAAGLWLLVLARRRGLLRHD